MSESTKLGVIDAVLERLQLRVRVFQSGAYCGAWALDLPSEHRASVHLVGRGQAWLHHASLPDPVAVRGGDLVLIAHGDAHQLSGAPARQPGPRFVVEGPGPYSTVICASVELASARGERLLRALPPVLVVRSEDADASAQLTALARLMLAEHEAGGIGCHAVLDRLAEAMFVLILRHHARRAPDASGVLGAAADERLVRALEALHGDLGRDWTLASLARVAGMSRTSFAARFHEVLDETPMQYLASWRMHVAAEALKDGRSSVTKVAADVGYRTEAAFRRAFKRHLGQGPGAVRREGRRADRSRKKRR